MNALDVAHAALLEVGGSTSLVDWDPENEVLISWSNADASKACWLAEMAVFGPTYMTYCQRCFDTKVTWPGNVCSPVRDVLRGMVCS